jgi:hypothetical protein
MSNLKSKYKDIVEAYMDAFCKKQDMVLESWVANDIGTIACFGDVMYFGFDDIRYDIDTNQPVGQILDWLYSSIDNPDTHINYKHWCKGLRYK